MVLPEGLRPHPTLGENIHPTHCVRCEEDRMDPLPMGENNRVFRCKKCEMRYFGFSKAPQTCFNKDCLSPLIKFERELAINESVPLNMCKKCERRHREANRIIEQGGILVQCDDCGMRGAVERDHEITRAVRKMIGSDDSTPIVYSFGAGQCPVCNGEMKNGHGAFNIIRGKPTN